LNLKKIIKLKNKYMKTIGEERVRTEFNPSKDDVVNLIKQKSAELINICEELKLKDARLASIAQTTYEEAAMWAVKAATA
jgi:predicted nucleic acid-binding OB-fold protein